MGWKLKHCETNTKESKIINIIKQFPEVFDGIGCFQNKQTGKTIEVRFEMVSEAISVTQLQQPLTKWLWYEARNV